MSSSTGTVQFNYKLVLAGDYNVGKTSYIKRLLTGEFEAKYVATLGAEVHRYPLENTPAAFEIWDTAGQEKFGGLREGYFIGADCAIVMFDRTSRETFNNVDVWIDLIKKVCGDIPIVVCGNKCDVENLKVTNSMIKSKKFDNYFDLSVKSCLNFEAPFWKMIELL